MEIMIYQFNESEWNMIVHTFEANKNRLSLVMRDNLKESAEQFETKQNYNFKG